MTLNSSLENFILPALTTVSRTHQHHLRTKITIMTFEWEHFLSCLSSTAVPTAGYMLTAIPITGYPLMVAPIKGYLPTAAPITGYFLTAPPITTYLLTAAPITCCLRKAANHCNRIIRVIVKGAVASLHCSAFLLKSKHSIQFYTKEELLFSPVLKWWNWNREHHCHVWPWSTWWTKLDTLKVKWLIFG